MKHDLSPIGRAELARLEAKMPRREAELARAEARYAEDRPRYEAQRRDYPKVREKGMLAIQAIGRIRDRIERTRAEIAFIRGEGPPPRGVVTVDDRAARSIERAFGPS